MSDWPKFENEARQWFEAQAVFRDSRITAIADQAPEPAGWIQAHELDWLRETIDRSDPSDDASALACADAIRELGDE